jgi:hypothetical protein
MKAEVPSSTNGRSLCLTGLQCSFQGPYKKEVGTYVWNKPRNSSYELPNFIFHLAIQPYSGSFPLKHSAPGNTDI